MMAKSTPSSQLLPDDLDQFITVVYKDEEFTLVPCEVYDQICCSYSGLFPGDIMATNEQKETPLELHKNRCNECWKEYKHQLLYEIHQSFHTNANDYWCNRCQYKTNVPSKLYQHMVSGRSGTTCHNESNVENCDIDDLEETMQLEQQALRDIKKLTKELMASVCSRSLPNNAFLNLLKAENPWAQTYIEQLSASFERFDERAAKENTEVEPNRCAEENSMHSEAHVKLRKFKDEKAPCRFMEKEFYVEISDDEVDDCDVSVKSSQNETHQAQEPTELNKDDGSRPSDLLSPRVYYEHGKPVSLIWCNVCKRYSCEVLLMQEGKQDCNLIAQCKYCYNQDKQVIPKCAAATKTPPSCRYTCPNCALPYFSKNGLSRHLKVCSFYYGKDIDALSCTQREQQNDIIPTMVMQFNCSESNSLANSTSQSTNATTSGQIQSVLAAETRSPMTSPVEIIPSSVLVPNVHQTNPQYRNTNNPIQILDEDFVNCQPQPTSGNLSLVSNIVVSQPDQASEDGRMQLAIDKVMSLNWNWFSPADLQTYSQAVNANAAPASIKQADKAAPSLCSSSPILHTNPNERVACVDTPGLCPSEEYSPFADSPYHETSTMNSSLSLSTEGFDQHSRLFLQNLPPESSQVCQSTLFRPNLVVQSSSNVTNDSRQYLTFPSTRKEDGLSLPRCRMTTRIQSSCSGSTSQNMNKHQSYSLDNPVNMCQTAKNNLSKQNPRAAIVMHGRNVQPSWPYQVEGRLPLSGRNSSSSTSSPLL